MYKGGGAGSSIDDEKLVLITIHGVESDDETEELASAHEIALRAHLDVTTVEGILARLIRRGAAMVRPPAYFVEVGPDPGPATYVLTDQGRTEIEA